MNTDKLFFFFYNIGGRISQNVIGNASKEERSSQITDQGEEKPVREIAKLGADLCGGRNIKKINSKFIRS